MTDLRPATQADAPVCAKIMQNWLDKTVWIPDLHTLDETIGFCRNVLIGKYETTVAGDPPIGFISIEPDNSVAAIYVAPTGLGTGTKLLHNAQANHDALSLWVFKANSGAIRFYHRHGFSKISETEGDNDEKLPDIRMGWHA